MDLCDPYLPIGDNASPTWLICKLPEISKPTDTGVETHIHMDTEGKGKTKMPTYFLYLPWTKELLRNSHTLIRLIRDSGFHLTNIYFFIFYFFKDFIYLFDRDSQQEREHKQGEWERKKQAPSGGA